MAGTLGRVADVPRIGEGQWSARVIPSGATGTALIVAAMAGQRAERVLPVDAPPGSVSFDRAGLVGDRTHRQPQPVEGRLLLALARSVKGAYGVLRLICNGKELRLSGSPKKILNIHDVATSGKEGVDLVTESVIDGRTVREFWEFTNVGSVSAATLDERQIAKHLRDKVIGEFDTFIAAGLRDTALKNAMGNIKLRFVIIAPNASAAIKASLYVKVMAQVRNISGAH